MSESKSDALTNLATPLHRSTVFSQREPQTFSVCEPTPTAGGCFKLRHILPVSPRRQIRRHRLPRATASRCLLSRTPRCLSPSCGCCRIALVQENRRRLNHLRRIQASAAACKSLLTVSFEHLPKTFCLSCLQAKLSSIAGLQYGGPTSGLGKNGSASRCLSVGLTTASHCSAARAAGVSLLPDTFDDGVATADEKRHVGTERPARAARRRARGQFSPQSRFRGEQGRSRVGAPATHAGAPGHLLVDRGCRRRATCALSDCNSARGAKAQVVRQAAPGRRSWRDRVWPSVRRSKCRRVAPVDQHEQRTAAGGNRRRAFRPHAGTDSTWPVPRRRAGCA